jgi:hypothetical protein
MFGTLFHWFSNLISGQTHWLLPDYSFQKLDTRRQQLQLFADTAAAAAAVVCC